MYWASRTAAGLCPCCEGADFWTNLAGEKVCRRCNPPVPGAEKAATEKKPQEDKEQGK